jgi:site-specific DNA-methyltransferase (adenine-specific)
MKPYYSDDLVTIYHGDARAWSGEADAMVTDPPYGVGLGIAKDMRGGRTGLAKKAYANYADTYDEFVEGIVPAFRHALGRVKRAATFIGPHIWEMPKADAIGGVYCPAGAGRHPWGFKTFLPVLFYGVSPTLQAGNGARPNTIQSSDVAEVNGHPCPKPESWMRWLVSITSLEGESVLDPFMGSGTTLVAAKSLGRKAIGIEIEERYCEIAATRCSQEVLGLTA